LFFHKPASYQLTAISSRLDLAAFSPRSGSVQQGGDTNPLPLWRRKPNDNYND